MHFPKRYLLRKHDYATYKKSVLFGLVTILTFFPTHSAFAGPQSTNYELMEYGFGSGGTAATGADSTNYTLFGTSGEVDTGQAESTTYKTNGGLIFTMQANVPPAPTFTNPSNYYNKLHFVLNTGNNPSDTTYAIAISTDNFVSDTRYVQSTNTIGATLGSEDWQTYASWGSASGFDIIGLIQDTTYTVKVTAEQGNFTQSAWSATSQQDTDPVSLTFDIDVDATDTETPAPYAVGMGALNIDAVTTANEKVWVDVSTNATNGGYVYIYDQYAGLRSSNVNHTISSASTNLSVATEGFGLRVDTVTGLTAVSPYNGAADNVGLIDSTVREILHTGAAPVTNGRASILVKAKTSAVTPSANDYTDTLTLISSATF